MRRAVDTNILVRTFVDEGTAECRLAINVMATGNVFVPATVILEAVWVMESSYGASRSTISDLLAWLLGMENVEVDRFDAVAEALEAYSRGFDFADALHLFTSPECDGFLTFDKSFLRRAKRHKLRLPVIRPS